MRLVLDESSVEYAPPRDEAGHTAEMLPSNKLVETVVLSGWLTTNQLRLDRFMWPLCVRIMTTRPRSEDMG